MAVIRLIAVAIIVSALCVVAHAQEGKPCPSSHICPVCSEENGVRTCRVERPGQPALPQLAAPTAPLDISPPSAGAPSPPPLECPVFQFGPFGRHIKCETKLFA